ncbi:MAG TPA: calcium/proton exchanger [Candidatus Obscuribacterales bacterium]
MQKLIYSLIIFIPLTFIAEYLMHNPTLAFISSCLGIIPMAKLMGDATEVLAHKVGGAFAGVLNSGLGNLAEMIIAVMALLKGEIEVLKASLTGSIIANILLVFGMSAFFGGLKREDQSFNKAAASASSSLLFIVIVALLIPSFMGSLSPKMETITHNSSMSLISAGLLLLMFAGSLIFSLKTHSHIYEEAKVEGQPEEEAHDGSTAKAVTMLIVTSSVIALLAEALTGTIGHASESLGLSRVFIGVVVVAIVGNAAEHSVAIMFAMKNKMNLAMNIALESSKQIATFITPMLVILGLILGKPFDLVFSPLEVIALFACVTVLNFVCQDGRSNWLEGLSMLALYGILGTAFFFFSPPEAGHSEEVPITGHQDMGMMPLTPSGHPAGTAHPAGQH